MYAHAPHFMKIESKNNLPWISADCRAAISAKHAAQGIDSYPEVSAQCTAVLQHARADYFYQLKNSMQRLARCFFFLCNAVVWRCFPVGTIYLSLRDPAAAIQYAKLIRKDEKKDVVENRRTQKDGGL